MTKNENEFIYKVLTLMSKCPQASPNPYDMTGWIHAARDYQKIHSLVYSCLNNFATYSTWKNKLGTGEIEDDFILLCQEKYQDAYEKLEAFIDKRINERWE